MIQAAFYTRGADIVRVHVSGHAGYAEFGQDIVCAGVSALVIAIANGLERRDIPSRTTSTEAGVDIQLANALSEDQNHLAQALLQTLFEGLQDIAASSDGADRVTVTKI